MEFEVYSDGGEVVLFVLAFDVAGYDGGFADALATAENHFEDFLF